MGINITSTEVIITDEEYSFSDIYQYAADQNNSSITNLGNSYKIDLNLTIKDNGKVKGLNNYIEITGEYITIEKGSTLQLGEVLNNGQTVNGCYLYAPNLELKYGFGNVDYKNSGNLLAYASTIDAWCFWSFFAGDNHVELIDCKVNAFGRISGSESIIYNVEHKYSNGKYGAFALLDTIKIYDKIIVKASKANGSNKVCLYHNPRYSKNMRITNSILDGYEKIAYIEDTSGGDKLELVDCDIRGNMTPFREKANVDLFVYYTYNPIILNSDSSTLVNTKVIIEDTNGNKVFDGKTNTNGEISVELLYYLNDRNENESYYNPYTVTIEKSSDEKMIYDIYVDKPLKKIPLYFSTGGSSTSGGEIDYERIQAMINASNEDIKETVNSNMEEIKNLQTMVNVNSDSIKQNERIIKETSSFQIII